MFRPCHLEFCAQRPVGRTSKSNLSCTTTWDQIKSNYCNELVHTRSCSWARAFVQQTKLRWLGQISSPPFLEESSTTFKFYSLKNYINEVLTRLIPILFPSFPLSFPRQPTHHNLRLHRQHGVNVTKPFSLTKKPNKLERFSLASPSRLVSC